METEFVVFEFRFLRYQFVRSVFACKINGVLVKIYDEINLFDWNTHFLILTIVSKCVHIPAQKLYVLYFYHRAVSLTVCTRNQLTGTYVFALLSTWDQHMNLTPAFLVWDIVNSLSALFMPGLTHCSLSPDIHGLTQMM